MSKTIVVELPDGSTKELPANSTGLDLAKSIGPKLAGAALAIEIDGKLYDLGLELADKSHVNIVVAGSAKGREILRHSTAHVLAQAVLNLWPGSHFAIGPPVEDGFYYDFELADNKRFTDEDLLAIEQEMDRIIDESQSFSREELSLEEGLKLFEDQPFKSEIIRSIGDGTLNSEVASDGRISVYRNGEGFVDLCRGPHVGSTDKLGSFKLLRVAGAYWRGDEKRQQLQRIYGTAWESRKALDDYLVRLAEAEKRDHRKLGVELDLFSFPEEIGSGLAVFHPKGGLIRKLMEDYSRKRHEAAGYQFVYSPHITKANLFEESGHLDWFADGMFPPMQLDNEQNYYLKPMNCPFHILIYRSRQRSYKELPLRLFEFGTVYRYEKSGVIHGLTRVRGMTQDDAHIFCSIDQMETELDSLLSFVLEVLGDYGLEDYFIELSTKPPGKAFGSDEDWERATVALSNLARTRSVDLVLDEGGGAFYGPKISVQVRDAIGRTWQMSTIQLDFQLPQRFGLEYVGSDNDRHRPVMIHRALFGTVERFFGILVEHYNGSFPLWLSPIQVRILPVRADHEDYCHLVLKRLHESGLRADLLEAHEPLGSRIRKSKLDRIPYILVAGDDDVNESSIGVNERGEGQPRRGVKIDDFISSILKEAFR